MILQQISLDPEKDSDSWYFDIPAIAQLAAEPLALDASVTVIVGENGSGKSTVLEAVAAAWASRLRGAVKHWTPRAGDEDSDLHWAVRLQGEFPPPAGGCFLRAEAMHQLFTEVDSGTPHQVFGGALNAQSHGESFLAFLSSRDTERGLFILDEPEAALSFTSCLQLMALMDSLIADGSQVLLATHSPVLAAFPGARILEFGEHGRRVSTWEDLPMVAHWRRFMSAPDAYLRHLFAAG
ncbi:AAA family ATPase [Mycobacterium neglectum]|uniref:AAA family ATPase n=1 Tax=Mycobacterium neglectum TaxID=242737 RepID=UPI000BFEC266|nr:AAA family ATPase [Mycobacterium neglectum]